MLRKQDGWAWAVFMGWKDMEHAMEGRIGTSPRSGIDSLIERLSTWMRKLVHTDRYRPERYYMRGPGPKFREAMKIQSAACQASSSPPIGANAAASQRPLMNTRAPAEGDGVDTSPAVSDRVAKTTCYM